MPTHPVNDIRHEGALRIPANVPSAGPADEMVSLTDVLPDGVLQQFNNNGAVITGTRGDGSKFWVIQTSTPINTQPGMIWLEETAGTTYLYYTDQANTIVQVPLSSNPVVGPVALTDGIPVAVDTLTGADTCVSWWVDIVDTNVSPNAHVSLRIEGAVQDVSTINWTTYGESEMYTHDVYISMVAGNPTLYITADGTGLEARVRSDVI